MQTCTYFVGLKCFKIIIPSHIFHNPCHWTSWYIGFETVWERLRPSPWSALIIPLFQTVYCFTGENEVRLVYELFEKNGYNPPLDPPWLYLYFKLCIVLQVRMRCGCLRRTATTPWSALIIPLFQTVYCFTGENEVRLVYDLFEKNGYHPLIRPDYTSISNCVLFYRWEWGAAGVWPVWEERLPPLDPPWLYLYFKLCIVLQVRMRCGWCMTCSRRTATTPWSALWSTSTTRCTSTSVCSSARSSTW